MQENHNNPSLNEAQPLSKRIWHWSTAVLIFASLTTVFIAKFLFSGSKIVLVKDTLQKSNVTITDMQAKPVLGQLRNIVWDWHEYIGYGIAAFLLFRIIFEFLLSKHQRLIPAIKKALKFVKATPHNKETKHYLLVKFLYLFFYFAIFVQTCTGLFMAYSDDIPSLKQARGLASNIHSVFMWVIIGFIVIHITGVVMGEIGKHKGIVSNMINGGNKPT